ncbi:GalE UDP-glucose 4-epimerase [uncultured Caudovirales phage]|uniref:GalE UDP-glucose 4-epimerase n=1 Tax=uncultured Caudovirales phage TaxID=2100421 RepID=A0A6J7WXL9_9CAUD|nr:GalE UDP-glucose 4-epimerase [uncultured Caudovirales phage]
MTISRLRVLVTGASGYIGSHVCRLLKEHGHYVVGWDTNVHGEHNDVSSWCDKFKGYDVTQSLSSLVIGQSDFDAVVHLAGRSVVPDSMREPTEYYRVNIMGTDNVLKSIKTPHFLFASTSSAWEMASPYARSKVAAEDVIKEKAAGYTIFRFFNVSGTDGVNRQLGESTHLIRVAAEVAAGKREYLNVYGTDYPTRDGTCIRDYVHVVDLAKAIVKAVETGPANTPYECLGSNKGYSVLDVLGAMREVTGNPVRSRAAPRREGDAVASVVDQLSSLITLEKSLHDMCLDQYKLEVSRNS